MAVATRTVATALTRSMPIMSPSSSTKPAVLKLAVVRGALVSSPLTYHLATVRSPLVPSSNWTVTVSGRTGITPVAVTMEMPSTD